MKGFDKGDLAFSGARADVFGEEMDADEGEILTPAICDTGSSVVNSYGR